MKKMITALLAFALVLSLCACDIFGKKDDGTTHTITFEMGGAQEVIAPITVPNGETAEIPIPNKDGCVFAGWYLDAELTNRYFFDYPLTEDTTLYAKFYDTTLGEYIVISNGDQFAAIKENPSAKYLLACDINCKGKTLAPIDEFTGELEGNGYKLYNYTMSENATNVALIRTNRGTVKNLSFDDFTFDIKNDGCAEKHYGVVCGINYGTVENCVVIDSEILITSNAGGDDSYLYIGGIAGRNYSVVSNCESNAAINVETTHGGYHNYNGWHQRGVLLRMGGIVGCNDTDASVSNCTNTGNLNRTSKNTTGGYSSNCIGGVVGYNLGSISASETACNVNVTCESNHADNYIGGFVGYNVAAVQNGSAQGTITVDNAAGTRTHYIGGFVGYTCGKFYNCYSTCNINDNTATITAIGGFAGYNEKLASKEYVIHKCFSTGNIIIAGEAVNAGKLVGLATGTQKECFYLDTVTVTKTTVTDEVETTVPVTLTNDIGTAKAESELLSMDFLENTMYFDRMVWLLVEGKLPELR